MSVRYPARLWTAFCSALRAPARHCECLPATAHVPARVRGQKEEHPLHKLLPTAVLLLAGSLAGCAFQQEGALRDQLGREAAALGLEDRASASEGRVVTDTLTGDPSLQDCLTYAALHSPRLRKAFYEWQAALEKTPQARSLPDPKFSYTHYVREVETRVGPQKNRFALMQMIPWPEKITSRTDMAVRQALTAKYLYEAEKLHLFHRVRQTYAEYYYLGRSLDILRDSMTLLENLEESLRTGYKADIAKDSDLNRMQVELGKLADRLESLAALRPARLARLNSILGRKPTAPMDLPESLPVEEPQLEEAELLERLTADNPGLRAAREKVRASLAGERLARADYFPDFGLSAGFIETDRRVDANPEDNGKDPVLVGVEVSLPLWRSKYAAGVREAQARRQASEAALEEKADNLAADLRLAFYKYEDAGRKQNLFAKTLVPKAEQVLESARSSYTAGQAAFADLIETERDLIELRLLAERARVDRLIGLSELEMLAGRALREESEGAQEAPHITKGER